MQVQVRSLRLPLQAVIYGLPEQSHNPSRYQLRELILYKLLMPMAVNRHLQPAQLLVLFPYHQHQPFRQADLPLSVREEMLY